MQNKKNDTAGIRLLVQTASFLAVVMLLILYRLYLKGLLSFKILGLNAFSPFGGLEIIYRWIRDADYVLPYYSHAFWLVLALIFSALIWGRFFCGWLCPFGTLQEYLGMMGKRVLGKNFSPSPLADKGLSYFKYIILAGILLSKITLGKSVLAQLDPWVAFVNVPGLPGALKEIPFSFLVLLGVLIGALFVSRFFCSYLCPLGALQAVLSGAGLVRLKRGEPTDCQCQNCIIKCQVNIEIKNQEEITSPECIGCMNCVGKCPGHAHGMELLVLGMPIRPVKYMIASLLMFMFLYLGFSPLLSRETQYVLGEKHFSEDTAFLEHASYKDGVYRGIGVGFAPGLTVEVEIRQGKIVGVDIVKHYETSGYYEEALKEIKEDVLEKQGARVDIVSGATYSSRGLKEAVYDALKKSEIP